MSNGERNASEVWKTVCGYIRTKSETAYKQWFKKLVPISIDEAQIVLGASDNFFASWVKNNFGDLLADALAFAGYAGIQVVFESGYCPEDAAPGDYPDESQPPPGVSSTDSDLINPELARLIRKHSFENFVDSEEFGG